MTIVGVLHAIAAVLLGAAAVLILFRILRGPSILDRMVASDVLVSSVVLVLGVEMVVNHHVRTLPIVLALSGTAVLGSIAVARYVSKHDRVEVVDTEGVPGVEEMEERAEGKVE
ncbi:monovalent cation/H+ antiporter complex subunit F [Naasia lichenicola]|uniref:Sodium:proton antiporter n=1 Tax=Naasia lichenicola TaxID=2565933 RepID=A0A4S4FPU5_9MICO|nr:monovalent cation/H+ antiporter complex subunit F [Naasia lichenicola]THG31832.1 sodium:proton antiporter [Naasia lichenicola]